MSDNKPKPPRNELEALLEIIGLLQTLINVTITGDEAIILAINGPTPPPQTIPDEVKIMQIKGDSPMPITGTNAGGQSTFEADALLAGVADPDGFPAGSVDTWTTDDILVSLGPDSGPNGSLVVASVDATDKAADYGLTVSVQMPADASGNVPAPLVSTIRAPIIQAPPPVPTGVAINQVA